MVIVFDEPAAPAEEFGRALSNIEAALNPTATAPSLFLRTLEYFREIVDLVTFRSVLTVLMVS